ncbi:heterogeneous nuclear ribonucleoprotein K, partial [Planomicrobium chinense]|nr:heterogeneous nuclear ribonucleoprotein K [Planococcus chinensis]
EHKHTQMRRIDLDVAAFDGGSVRAHQHRRFFEIFAVWLVWDTFLQEEVGLGV